MARLRIHVCCCSCIHRALRFGPILVPASRSIISAPDAPLKGPLDDGDTLSEPLPTASKTRGTSAPSKRKRWTDIHSKGHSKLYKYYPKMEQQFGKETTDSEIEQIQEINDPLLDRQNSPLLGQDDQVCVLLCIRLF